MDKFANKKYSTISLLNGCVGDQLLIQMLQPCNRVHKCDVAKYLGLEYYNFGFVF